MSSNADFRGALHSTRFTLERAYTTLNINSVSLSIHAHGRRPRHMEWNNERVRVCARVRLTVYTRQEHPRGQ